MRATIILKPIQDMRATKSLKPNKFMRAKTAMKPNSNLRANRRVKPNSSLRNQLTGGQRMTDLKQFETMTIVEIESKIKSNNMLSLEARKESILALLYLKRSGRYKENKLYAKSSWKNYLLDFHNIRENSFNESARAFDKYSKEACKYGVGLVAKITRECGVKKEKEVLKEIKDTQKKLKTPIKRAKIKEIIYKHSKPEQPKAPGYKTRYIEEVRLHQITKTRHDEAISELKAAHVQIEKLKATILKLKKFKDVFDAINEKEPEMA